MLCLTIWGGVPREFWPCIRRFSSIFYARILCEFWEVGPRHFYISRPQRYRCGQISRIFQVNIDIWTIRMSLVTTGLRACSLYGQRESMRVNASHLFTDVSWRVVCFRGLSLKNRIPQNHPKPTMYSSFSPHFWRFWGLATPMFRQVLDIPFFVREVETTRR